MNADPEQIEFLLSQVPDGTLTAEEQQAVKAALAADPALVALAARYASLASLINKLKATRISFDDAALADHIRDGLQTELEYQISQDMDGLLDAAASEQLSKVVASSHAFQSREQGLRDVQRLLARYGSAQPAIDMGGLSAGIRSTIRTEAVRETAPRRADRPRVYRLAAWLTPVAAAAALLIAVFAWRPGTPDSGGQPGHSPAPTPYVKVIVREPRPAGSVTVEPDMSEQVAATESEGSIIISSGAQRERDPAKERRRTETALLYAD